MNEQYPNDKESQEWMNAPLGKPVSTPEEQVRFWSDKYDAKVNELHEMWKRARSFEVDFNAATEAIKRLEEEVSFLKESRSKWANQSRENADDLESLEMKLLKIAKQHAFDFRLLKEQSPLEYLDYEISRLNSECTEAIGNFQRAKAEIEEIQGQYEKNIDFWQRKSSNSQKIGYKCPSCRNSTVTIDSSGFLVCALIGCKDPSRIHEIISREIIWENGMEL